MPHLDPKKNKVKKSKVKQRRIRRSSLSKAKLAAQTIKHTFTSKLKAGDTVMVIVGGNSQKGKIQKGLTGKVLKVLPKKSRVIVEGLNFVKRHKKASTSQETSGVVVKEGSIHISNVMFYAESIKRPVRLASKVLADGRKVRVFKNPITKEFEQVDA